MNILLYFALAGGSLIAGHKFLKASVESVVKPDPNRKTAAVLYEDNKDYVPTHPIILFGHHWMSIAGTSPIIASIVGLAWGWVPAFLWMILGVLFIGGVHDYFTTMLSTRNKGVSMGELLKERIGKASSKFGSVLLGFGSLLVFAIFLFVLSRTLEATPTAVIPTVGLAFLAVFAGIMLKRGWSLLAVSLVCVAFIFMTVLIGLQVPIALPLATWIWVFGIYTFIAISTPVWILLQPRDYLDSFVLIAVVALGILGLLIARPAIQFPAFISWVDPIANRPLWPMIFSIISCGAASGWHTLIAAGTTSKQLRNEKDAFPIAYGGMQGETALALLSSALIITTITLADFRAVLGNPGLAFATALGRATTHLGFPHLVGATLGALGLSALTMTTMDSYARTARYVVQELAVGTFLAKSLPSAVLVIVSGMALYFTVPFMALWGGLVLGGLVALIFPLIILLTEKVQRKEAMDFSFKLHVVAPLIFLYATSYGALLFKLQRFVRAENWIPVVMILFLMVLGVVIAVESYLAMKKPMKKPVVTATPAGE